jgi:nucleoside-diphosphate kinase
MAGNITLTIIKPVAFRKNYAGQILCRIAQAGFRISAIRSMQLSREQAAEFYKIHEDKPFYEDLVEFMASGPVIVALLEKENAVEMYRRLLGNTNPCNAEEGTLRNLFGTSIRANALHGSDSDENAEREADFFFKKNERF